MDSAHYKGIHTLATKSSSQAVRLKGVVSEVTRVTLSLSVELDKEILQKPRITDDRIYMSSFIVTSIIKLFVELMQIISHRCGKSDITREWIITHLKCIH